MFDEDGQPVSKDVLEANLEKAVEDGYLSTEDMAVVIEMFDYCISGGMGAGSAGMPRCSGMGGAGFSGCPFSR